MNWINSLFDALYKFVQWWFIVLPWEQGLRLRAGKHVRVLAAGIHFKIPFIDRVCIQNTRLHVLSVDAQTLTTADGKTVTCGGSLEFCITDIRKMYETLTTPEGVIKQNTNALVSDFIVRHTILECRPADISDYVSSELKLERFGLSAGKFYITNFAAVKTYRIINDGMHQWLGQTPDTEVKK